MKKILKEFPRTPASVQRRRALMHRIMETVRAELAALLRRVRQARGLTRVQLAERSGLSRQMVAKIERCVRRPTFESVLQLVLGMEYGLERLARVLTRALRAACAG